MGECPALGRLSSVKVTSQHPFAISLPALITRNHDLEADPRSPPYRGDSTALQLRPSEEGTEAQGAGTAGRESQKTCKKKRSQN